MKIHNKLIKSKLVAGNTDLCSNFIITILTRTGLHKRNLISPYSLILIFRLFLPLPLFFFFLPNNYFYTAFNTYMNVLNDTHRGSLWFWPPLKWVTSPFCWNVVSFDSDTHWRWVKHMAKRVCRNCPIPKCGAKYLVKLSNHLTDVHRLDYQISIEGSG